MSAGTPLTSTAIFEQVGALPFDSPVRDDTRSHLAVMKRDPLRRLLSGEKIIESRFSMRRVLPHGGVAAGDRIFFKESSGPVRATAIASSVSTWELKSPDDVDELRRIYNRWITATDEFWADKSRTRWATLIVLSEVQPLLPVPLNKRDRLPWVILKPCGSRG